MSISAPGATVETTAPLTTRSTAIEVSLETLRGIAPALIAAVGATWPVEIGADPGGDGEVGRAQPHRTTTAIPRTPARIRRSPRRSCCPAQRNARRNLWLGSESADASTCSLKAPIRRPLRARRTVPLRGRRREAAYPRLSKLGGSRQARCPRPIHRTLSGRTSTLGSPASMLSCLNRARAASGRRPAAGRRHRSRARPQRPAMRSR